jgi:hypothetical protein
MTPTADQFTLPAGGWRIALEAPPSGAHISPLHNVTDAAVGSPEKGQAAARCLHLGIASTEGDLT